MGRKINSINPSKNPDYPRGYFFTYWSYLKICLLPDTGASFSVIKEENRAFCTGGKNR